MAHRVISRARNYQVAFGAKPHQMVGSTGWISRE
jgi:hypothetical protein